MNADAKFDAALGRQTGVALDHAALHFDRAAHGVDDAAKLDDGSIAGALDDAPVMHGDGGIDQVAAQRAKPRQSAILVRSGEPAVADHVRDQDRRDSADGHVVRLDDPMATTRLPAEEIDGRDTGLYCFVPCVSKEGTIAVMALGGKESGEPLNSEDMGLLEAVAGQVATACENGRLYHQLQRKAAELDREKRFNENIVESLDDGLLVASLDDRVLRWNPALERIYGIARADAVGRRLDELFDRGVSRLAARRAPRSRQRGRDALSRADVVAPRRRAPQAARQRRRRAAADARRRSRPEPSSCSRTSPRGSSSRNSCRSPRSMASIGLLAAGVAHEVNTPLTGISSFTQMLLESADPDDPRTKLLEKIERQTFRAARIVNGLLNLARPAKVEQAPVASARRRQRRAVAARAPVPDRQRAGAQGASPTRRRSSWRSSTSCSRCSSTCS